MISRLPGLKVIQFEGIVRARSPAACSPISAPTWSRSFARTRRLLGDPDRPSPMVRCGAATCRRARSQRAQAVPRGAGDDRDGRRADPGQSAGVMERLNIGPADCARRNPRLVYAAHDRLGQEARWRAPRATIRLSRVSGVFARRPRRAGAMTPPTVVGRRRALGSPSGCSRPFSRRSAAARAAWSTPRSLTWWRA